MGRFTSADPVPMTSQRPSDPQRLNLYAYVRNNPLVHTDPNGLEIIVTGDEAKQYVKKLEKASRLKLKLDEKTGAISIKKEPKNLTAVGQQIKTIIGDTKNTVSIEATKNRADVLGGQFNGNGKQTLDFTDIKQLSKGGGFTAESIVVHETTEAYEGLVNPGGGFQGAHQVAIGFENQVRAQQGKSARSLNPENAAQNGNDVVVTVDFATHTETITVDANNLGNIKSVKVEKKP